MRDGISAVAFFGRGKEKWKNTITVDLVCCNFVKEKNMHRNVPILDPHAILRTQRKVWKPHTQPADAEQPRQRRGLVVTRPAEQGPDGD